MSCLPLGPERNRSFAAITVRTFFQAELQTIVDKLRTLNGEASREPLFVGCCMCPRQVASKVTIDGAAILFKMLAEKGVAEVNGFVSRIVKEVEARLDDQVLELFHSQGLLHRVRAGARKWQMLGVSVGSVAEKWETAVARLEAVLTLLGVDSVNSLCADGDPDPKQFTKPRKDQRAKTSVLVGVCHTVRGVGCRGRTREAGAVG